MSREKEEGPDGPAPMQTVIPLHAEEVVVARRKVDTAQVRVGTVTHEVTKLVNEEFIRERADIERTVIGRIVDAMPQVRQEGDMTVIPVIEEVVVVQRKFLLKEEIRVRRVRTTEQHVETVTLRHQEVEIVRTPLAGPDTRQVGETGEPS